MGFTLEEKYGLEVNVYSIPTCWWQLKPWVGMQSPGDNSMSFPKGKCNILRRSRRKDICKRDYYYWCKDMILWNLVIQKTIRGLWKPSTEEQFIKSQSIVLSFRCYIATKLAL